MPESVCHDGIITQRADIGQTFSRGHAEKRPPKPTLVKSTPRGAKWFYVLLAGLAVQLIHRVGRDVVAVDLFAAAQTPSTFGKSPRPFSYGSITPTG